MSYQILYDPELKHKFPPRREVSPTVRWRAFIFVTMLLFLMSIPGALESLKDGIFPGDSAVTEAAFIDLVEDLEAGEPLAEAFADFCVTIINDERSSDESTDHR